MAPVKFEENIREKLEQREIKPSVSAWERLEKGLDASAKRKSNKTYTWWLIAAGFIGVLILAGELLTSVPETIQNPVVTTPVEELQEQSLPQQEPFLPEQEQVVQKTRVVLVEKKEQNVENKKATPVAPAEIAKGVAVEETVSEPLEEPIQQQVDAEVEKLLNNITKQQNSGVAYSDAEIDKLLRDAQRDIITEKLLTNDRNAVSAEALLYEVEEELDPSFKDRVFEALKEGFLKAREAVASRND